MHASHIYGMTYKTNFNLAINSFFKIQNLYFLFKKKAISGKFLDLYLMKIQIRFLPEKISDLYLVKIHICFLLEKISDLYLMKIKIYF